jgi:hypothetical protein
MVFRIAFRNTKGFSQVLVKFVYRISRDPHVLIYFQPLHVYQIFVFILSSHRNRICIFVILFAKI